MHRWRSRQTDFTRIPRGPWRMTSRCFSPIMEMFCTKLVHATSFFSCRGCTATLGHGRPQCDRQVWCPMDKAEGLGRPKCFPPFTCVNCTPCIHAGPSRPQFTNARLKTRVGAAALRAVVAKRVDFASDTSNKSEPRASALLATIAFAELILLLY